ncbi:MAG: hypothetical protein IPQ04_14500 [Saprospiraceae bacterium]|nr:hypothetical protein [Saprospiraceae bacterium]
MRAPNACGGTANVTVTVGTTSASGCDITTSCVRTFTVLPDNTLPSITCIPGGNLGCNAALPIAFTTS